MKCSASAEITPVGSIQIMKPEERWKIHGNESKKRTEDAEKVEGDGPSTAHLPAVNMLKQGLPWIRNPVLQRRPWPNL